MKIYRANVDVQAVFFDGTMESEKEVVKFTMTARGVKRVVRMSAKKGEDGLFIKVSSQYASVWLPIEKNSYVVKYPSNLIYPYKKSLFEKKFKEIT